MNVSVRNSFLFILLGLFAFVNSYGQSTSGVKPWVLAGQKGDYKFFNYNDTAIRTKIIDVLAARSKEDKEYFENSVKRIEEGFASLLRTTVYYTPENSEIIDFNNGQKKVDQKSTSGLNQIKASKWSLYGLKALSDESTLRQEVWIPVGDLAASIRRFNQEVVLLKAKIKRLTALADGGFPSQTQGSIGEDGKVTQFREYGQAVDFTPIVAYFNGRIAEVVAQVETFEFKVILSTGTKGQSKGLTVPKDLFKIAPEVARKIYDTEILPLLGWNPEQRESIDGFNQYLKKLIQTFIEDYGTSERFRLVDGDAVKTNERNSAFKLIVNAFWFRSYIRAIYGTPVGSLALQYDKKIFHIDKFWNSTESLGNFLPEFAWSDADQASIRDDIRVALELAGDRSVRILDNGDAGFLTKANSFFTYVGGKRNLADTNLMILQLIAADLYEDILIKKPNGLVRMLEQYQNRYYATDDTKKYYQGLEDTYFPEKENSNSDNTSAFADQNTLPYFIKKIGFLGDMKLNELALVAQRKEMLEAFFKANGMAEKTKRRRRGRLRGK